MLVNVNAALAAGLVELGVPLVLGILYRLGDVARQRREDRLAVEFAQPWFVLERVHLTHPTLHEKENAALGFAWKMAGTG